MPPGAQLVTDLSIVHNSHVIMHFICFSTIILDIAESLQHTGLYKHCDSELVCERLRVILTLLFHKT